MARRTALGMALGSWIGGRPKANDVAGATLTGYDDQGRPIYQDDNGDDVTDAVSKAGTGLVRQPGMAMRLFNPEGASRADEMNLEYATKPAAHRQDTDLAEADARRHVANTIRLITGEEPDPKMVEQIASMEGTRVEQGGAGADIVNKVQRAQEQAKAGYGRTVGSLDVAGTEGDLRKINKYNSMGGPEMAGAAAATSPERTYRTDKTFLNRGGAEILGGAEADQAQASGDVARTTSLNEPYRRALTNFQYQKQLERQPTEEAANDQELALRMGKLEKVDPLILQRAELQARAELGREPTEQELADVALRNKLYEAKNVTPLGLVGEQNVLQAKNDASSDIYRSIRNRASQELALSGQPPEQLLATPKLFNKTGDESGNPAAMYKQQQNISPLYISPIAARMASMSALTSAGGPTVGGVRQLSSGGGVNLSPSAPAVGGNVASPNGPNMAPATAPPAMSAPTRDYIGRIKRFSYMMGPNAGINSLGDAVAERIGPPSSTPALSVGGSTINYRSGKIYSDALLGNQNGMLGQLSGDQVMDYLNGLPQDQQQSVYQSAWSKLRQKYPNIQQ